MKIIFLGNYYSELKYDKGIFVNILEYINKATETYNKEQKNMSGLR